MSDKKVPSFGNFFFAAALRLSDDQNGCMRPMRERTSQNGTEPLQETATEAAQQITDRLRQLYESVQAEGIPDKFLDLLERLDEAEQRSLKK